MAESIIFPSNGEAILFPKDGETLILPAGTDLAGDTTLKISGSDFVLQFPDGRSLTLLFGGIFASIGNNLNIQDSKGTILDLNYLISSYETSIANNVLLQSIDAMSLNQLLEKTPEDQEGQEIASGNAEDGTDGNATGRAGKSKNEQEEEEFKLTTERKTDDKVDKVTGSGSSELGGDDDLEDAQDISSLEEEKTQDFEQTLNQYTSFGLDVAPSSQTETIAGAPPATPGSAADSESAVQTTFQLTELTDTFATLNSDFTHGSPNDSITNFETLEFTGSAKSGVAINIYKYSDWVANQEDSSAPLIAIATVNESHYGGTAISGTEDIWTISLEAEQVFSEIVEGENILIAVPEAGIPSAPLRIVYDTSTAPVNIGLDVEFQGQFDPLHTSSSSPKITGTAEGGSLVLVQVDGASLASPVLVDSNGYWEQELNSLTNGDYIITADSYDLAGNVQSSVSLNITVSSLNPSPPTISSISADRQDAKEGDGFVGDDTPVVSGIGVAGEYIEIYIDNIAQTPFEISNPNGTWEYTVTNSLVEGAHTFYAIAYTKSGLASEKSAEVTTLIANPDSQLTIDIAEDSDSGIVGDLYTNKTESIVLEGRGVVDEQLTISNTVDGVETILGTATVGVDGVWEFTVPSIQATGAQDFTVIRSATSESVATTLTIDTLVNAPAVSISNTTKSGDIYYTKIPLNNELSISTEPFSTVNITINNDGTQVIQRFADANGVITINFDNLSLNVGGNNQINYINLDVIDRAGNTNSDEVVVVVNPSAISAITAELSNSNKTGGEANATYTKNPDVTIVGITDPGASVSLEQSINNQTVVVATLNADINGNYSAPASLTSLSDGSHLVRVVASNITGLTKETTLQFIVDTVAPDAPIIALQGTPLEVTNETTPVLNGAGGTQGDVINIYNGGFLIETNIPIIVDSSGSWEAEISGIQEGFNNITATATDRAGNVSELSEVFTLELDTVIELPTVQLAEDSQGLFDITHTPSINFVLEGTAEPNSSIKVNIAGNTISSILTDEQGNWSTTNPFGLTSGVYEITLTATDVAGNSATAEVFSITLDTVSPNVPDNITIENINNANEINDVTPVIQGTAEAGSYIEIIAVTLNNKVYPAVQVDADGNWEFEISRSTIERKQSNFSESTRCCGQ